MIALRFKIVVVAALVVAAPSAQAWPGELSQRIARDALRLVPQSLADVMLDNQEAIFADAGTYRMPALSLIYQDLPGGRLTDSTKKAIGQELGERVRALQGSDFRGAVIALGAAYRLVVDLADPGVGAGLGADPRARATRREFYLFVGVNRDKIPLVVEPGAMGTRLEEIPGFLARLAAKSPAQAALLREEGHQGGRVLPFGEIDFKSPVFAVASSAYSRSVSAVAAVWIATWRSAGGDMTRQKPLRAIHPGPFESSEGK